MGEKKFKTKRELAFEVAPWTNPLNIDGWILFRVGTCHGSWRFIDDRFEILAIANEQPGNGHLDDVFEWFENSCKNHKASLQIREIWNKKFKEHLLTKARLRKAWQR